jgi:hypothetical protein
MSEHLLDLSRLTAEERELWDEYMTGPSADGPAVQISSFGYISMLELGRVPEVVAERRKELDPDNLVLQYYENVRRAREEERRRQTRHESGDGRD